METDSRFPVDEVSIGCAAGSPLPPDDVSTRPSARPHKSSNVAPNCAARGSALSVTVLPSEGIGSNAEPEIPKHPASNPISELGTALTTVRIAGVGPVPENKELWVWECFNLGQENANLGQAPRNWHGEIHYSFRLGRLFVERKGNFNAFQQRVSKLHSTWRMTV